MYKNNKKTALYLIPFLISFLFIVFIHSLNINTRFTPLKSEKESAIFLDDMKSSDNYISVRVTNRVRVTDIFSGRDTLPDLICRSENNVILHKTIKLLGKIVKENKYLSIVQRYKARILLI